MVKYGNDALYVKVTDAGDSTLSIGDALYVGVADGYDGYPLGCTVEVVYSCDVIVDEYGIGRTLSVTASKDGDRAGNPTILFEGESYSICIPDSGWSKDSGDNGGYDSWSTEAGDASVSIATYRDMTLQEVYDKLLLTHEGFELEGMDENHCFSGADDFNELMVFAKLIPINESVLVVWAECMYKTPEDVKLSLKEIAASVQTKEQYQRRKRRQPPHVAVGVSLSKKSSYGWAFSYLGFTEKRVQTAEM